MFGFLQGFAYGLFLSCLPWFLIGMLDPRLAVPSEPPTRWGALLRYWLGVPFVAFALWLTSLWGGFGPSFLGWVAGLGALVVAIPAERRWHRWKRHRLLQRRRALEAAAEQQQRAERERAAREAGVAELDPARPPADADRVVTALWQAKKALVEGRRSDYAVQADRLYTRYTRVLATLSNKFDEREVTFGRSRELVAEVGLGAADNLSTMAALAAGVVGIDAEYVKRRLADRKSGPSADERDALLRRLDLVADTERRLAALAARNETAMTTLDDAVVVMSRVDTDRPQASVASDQALADLKRFMDKAERYGQHH